VVSATPPRSRYAAHLCGGSLPSDRGIVRGRLSPALARLALATTAGAPPYIAALWSETLVDAGQMERCEMASSASAVRASAADAVTGELTGRVTADGQFSLQRPTHSQQSMVRRVRHQPRFVDIEPMQAIVAIGEMRLVLVP